MNAAIAAYVGSFNFAIGTGLQYAIQSISPMQASSDTQHVKISIYDAVVKKLSLPERQIYNVFPLYPSECHLRAETYCADLIVKLKFQTSSGLEFQTERKFKIPVAVKSNACHLQDSNIDWREEQNNIGGYFIVNGKERLMRMFLIQRRNYPLAMTSPLWQKTIKEEKYSQFGIRMRCVAKDETISEISLRFLEDCDVKVVFSHNGYKQFVSLMLLLKSLGNYSDRELFKKICDDECDIFNKGCVLAMLRKLQSQGILTNLDAKMTLGLSLKSFTQLPTNVDVANFIIRECILIHLEENEDKVNLLCYMAKKLFDLVRGKYPSEDPDNFVNQELLLGGQLYLMLLKVEIKNFLRSVKSVLEKKLKSGGSSFILSESIAKYCTNHAAYIGGTIKSAISTGNIPAAKLGLKLAAGYSILCERTNYVRFCSHFTAVHKFIFNPYSTASFRRLHPEYWGYFCPIHTPSGETTGLSNHIAQSTLITHSPIDQDYLWKVVFSLGMLPCNLEMSPMEKYIVMVDGKIAGYIPDRKVEDFVFGLRSCRRSRNNKDLSHIEIVFVKKNAKTQDDEIWLHPGVFIFTTSGRILRPLKNISTEHKEYIGPFEQLFLSIALSPKERRYSLHSHEEISSQNILSDIGSSIPFLECNPSPRNIYSCQMAKQALGIPSHNFQHRADTKIYQFINPQIPLVGTVSYDKLHFDEYPAGTNALVAVISYSGYDMEDAIVFNKSSLENGLSHTSIFKTVFVDLQEQAKELNVKAGLRFLRDDRYITHSEKLDIDGLPYLGQKMNSGDPYVSYVDKSTGESFVKYYQETEPAYVHEVNLLGNHESPLYLTKVSIKFRISRKVEIGDKFANRHGQKGVVGSIFQAEDMPFSENGIVPDILFNPHGFPSRMSIGMAIEAMAALTSAVSGKTINVTPFKFSEKHNAVEYFTSKLLEAGFNTYSTEKMYSGVSGQELNAVIFHGIVYYERLRHMVADKYQVRSVGRVSRSLRQPIKSDPRDGALRFGEMERDSLIAHGTSFLLSDRFLRCSDSCKVYLCRNCQGILYPSLRNSEHANCQLCEDQQDLVPLKMPFAFVALVAELSSVNIKIRLSYGLQ